MFLKSGVTLEGSFNAEFTDYTHFIVYDDPNTISSGEDAVIVIDGATDVSVRARARNMIACCNIVFRSGRTRIVKPSPALVQL